MQFPQIPVSLERKKSTQADVNRNSSIAAMKNVIYETQQWLVDLAIPYKLRKKFHKVFLYIDNVVDKFVSREKTEQLCWCKFKCMYYIQCMQFLCIKKALAPKAPSHADPDGELTVLPHTLALLAGREGDTALPRSFFNFLQPTIVCPTIYIAIRHRQ